MRATSQITQQVAPPPPPHHFLNLGGKAGGCCAPRLPLGAPRKQQCTAWRGSARMFANYPPFFYFIFFSRGTARCLPNILRQRDDSSQHSVTALISKHMHMFFFASSPTECHPHQWYCEAGATHFPTFLPGQRDDRHGQEPGHGHPLHRFWWVGGRYIHENVRVEWNCWTWFL